MMKRLLSIAVVLLLFLPSFLFLSRLVANESPAIVVDCDFPGGNILVETITDGRVSVGLDKRDSPQPCFYWSFRVRHAEGRTLTFDFSPARVVSKRGPVISTDGGVTWNWQHPANETDSTSFIYPFGPDEKEVYFAVAPPYTQETFNRFLESYPSVSSLQRETLCRSSKGRNIELIRFGTPHNSGRIGVVFTARHHARESTASYVLEGILAEIFSESAEGKWLLANADYFVVPFVDLDGVQDGDPGKNRIPHDHNRDYLEKIYPSVQAITNRIPSWSEGKRIIHLDFHCPQLSGQDNELLFFTNYPASYQYDQLKRFSDLLIAAQKGGAIPYDGMKSPGEAPNPAMSRAWFSSLPNNILSGTVEVPYVSAANTPMTRVTLTELGHHFAKTLTRFIEQEIENPTNKR